MILFLILILTLGCGKKDAGNSELIPEKKSETPDEYSYSIMVQDSIPELKILFSGDTTGSNYKVNSLHIYRDDSLVQSISEIDSEFPLDFRIEPLAIGDMNFDGYKDFRLVEFIPAAPNVPYIYFFYDPEKKNFYRNNSFEAITSPKFDFEKKEVSSSWRGSAVTYGTDIYEVKNNRPELVRQVIDERNEEGIMMRRTYINKNGEMELQNTEPVQ